MEDPTTTAAAPPPTPTTPPEIPGDLTLFEFDNLEDLLDNATPLTNGWLAVDLDDDWWEIFDENGVPLGVIFLPGDIYDYDFDFIFTNMLPLAVMAVPEPPQQEQQEQPQPTAKNPQTGDAVFALLGLLALAAAAAVIYKKRQKTYDILRK